MPERPMQEIEIRGRVKTARVYNTSKTADVDRWTTQLTVEVERAIPASVVLPSDVVYVYADRKPGLAPGVRVVLRANDANAQLGSIRVHEIEIVPQ